MAGWLPAIQSLPGGTQVTPLRSWFLPLGSPPCGCGWENVPSVIYHLRIPAFLKLNQQLGEKRENSPKEKLPEEAALDSEPNPTGYIVMSGKSVT